MCTRWFFFIPLAEPAHDEKTDGFHKLPIPNKGADDASSTFQQNYFRQGQPHLLALIERKKPSASKRRTREFIRPYPHESIGQLYVEMDPPLACLDWSLPSPTEAEIAFPSSSHPFPSMALPKTFRESYSRIGDEPDI